MVRSEDNVRQAEAVTWTHGIVRWRINVGGPQVAANDGTLPAWSADTAVSPSPYLTANGANIYADSANSAYGGTVNMGHPSLPPGAPAAIFTTERYDAGSAGDLLSDEMQWDFPVTPGSELEVRLYFAELWTGITGPGQRVFDIAVEGSVPAAFADVDAVAQADGIKSALMLSTTLTAGDDTLDVNFLHQVQNPTLKGIEIIEFTSAPPPVVERVANQAVAVGQTLTATARIANTMPEPLTITVDSLPDASAFTAETVTSAGAGSYTLTLAFNPAAGDAGHYAFTITAEDGASNPSTETFTLEVYEPDTPQALVTVTAGGGPFASSASSNTFHIRNTGWANILSVTVDLGSAWMPDVVFDPAGTAGVGSGKCLTVDSGATVTGYVVPGDPCVDPYSVPHEGNVDDGYERLTIHFTDFNPGETFAFSNNIEPNTIKNLANTDKAENIAGFELIGARVAVGFAPNAVLASNLYEDGSPGGAVATVTPEEAPAPIIAMQAVTPPASSAEAQQTVLLQGTPGATFSLLQPVARRYADSNDPVSYEANELLSRSIYSGTFDGSGEAAVPVTLFLQNGPGAGPDADLHHFIAVEDNGSGDFGRTSNSFVVRYAPPPPPAICINAGSEISAVADDRFFSGDRFYSLPAGYTYDGSSSPQPIANTTADQIYQSERFWNPFTYTVPVSDGFYTVELMFAEIFHGVLEHPNAGDGVAGDRIFNVDLEGSTVLSNYDIISKTGAPLTAITETFAITVADGSIETSFYLGPGGVDQAKLSAMCVTALAPVTPTLFIAQMGGDVQLAWDDDPANYQYAVHIGASPYFSAADALTVTLTSDPFFTHTGGAKPGDFYYFVGGLNGDRQADSGRKGAFTFPLVPGSASAAASPAGPEPVKQGHDGRAPLFPTSGAHDRREGDKLRPDLADFDASRKGALPLQWGKMEQKGIGYAHLSLHADRRLHQRAPGRQSVRRRL